MFTGLYIETIIMRDNFPLSVQQYLHLTPERSSKICGKNIILKHLTKELSQVCPQILIRCINICAIDSSCH